MTRSLSLIIMIFYATLGIAEASQLQLSPLFRSCSYYWNGTADKNARPYVRETGSEKWLPGFLPVHDLERQELRGSVLSLKENTSYDFELRTENGQVLPGGSASFRTLGAKPPIARTIILDENSFDGHLSISDQGSPDGWIRYTVKPGFVLTNPKQAVFKEKNFRYHNSSAMINIRNAKYILLEGLAIRGGMTNAIHVEKSSHIRIVNCDISGWGRAGIQRFDLNGRFYPASGEFPKSFRGFNYDAAIYLKNSDNLVIERNYIHDPLGRANSWTYAHPAGPEAVMVHIVRNTVIRYNDFIGSDAHRFNDAVEGWGNFHPRGGFNQDAEIYGNFMIFCNDDNIELDGGQQNVRCFGNRFEGALCGVSIQGCMTGPSYVYNNLITDMGDERGEVNLFLKTASPRSGKFAASYIFGNTFSGPGRGTDVLSHHKLFIFNNIFDGANNRVEHAELPSAIMAGNLLNDMSPHFRDPSAGDYRLAPDSPARKRGVAYGKGSKPDAGAFSGDDAPALPLRPIPVNLNAGKLLFAPEQRQLRLQASNTGKKTLAFRITQNRDFDWFEVLPASGKIEPGQSVEFTVKLDPTRFIKQPVMRGAFLLRFADGLSRPVSVYANTGWTMPLKPHGENDFVVYFNPEEADAKRHFPRLDPARGPEADGMVQFPFRGTPAESGSSEHLSFEFDTPKDGFYGLFVRCALPEPVGQHDSFFYSFDDEPMRRGDFSPARSGKPRWFMVSESSGHQESRSAFFLSKGRHILHISPREKTLIGLIAITDNHYAFEYKN